MTFANDDVLAFYKELPFNYRASAEADVAQIRNTNSLVAYPPLLPFLTAKARVLDVGCGSGWLSNQIAFHYGCEVTALDFNSVALARARGGGRTPAACAFYLFIRAPRT